MPVGQPSFSTTNIFVCLQHFLFVSMCMRAHSADRLQGGGDSPDKIWEMLSPRCSSMAAAAVLTSGGGFFTPSTEPMLYSDSPIVGTFKTGFCFKTQAEAKSYTDQKD